MEQLASKPISKVSLLLAVAPIIVSVGLAYGTAKFAQGETRESIQTLKKQQEQMVTREELRQYIDATREDLREIKKDIREIRDFARGE